MRLRVAFVLAAACCLAGAHALAGAPAGTPAAPDDSGQSFMLRDYRWVPVIVRRVPAAVDCRYEVVRGKPTVHVELLSDRDFALFARRREYETLAVAEGARSGGFQRMIETPGRYRVLVRNDPGAAPVAMSLTVRTDIDPPPFGLSSGIAPQRKFVVIAISLTGLFATVFWSGRKLLRAYRNR